jgi:hypothetical protein
MVEPYLVEIRGVRIHQNYIPAATVESVESLLHCGTTYNSGTRFSLLFVTFALARWRASASGTNAHVILTAGQRVARTIVEVEADHLIPPGMCPASQPTHMW